MFDSCRINETNLLTLEEALLVIRKQVQPISGTEKVTINRALGRILVRPPRAPIDLPQHRNAAMDGYAIASSDIDAEQPFRLSLAGASWAGSPFTGSLKPGQCIRIFTGALVPDQLDTVVMQEQVVEENGKVFFPPDIRARQYIREAGDDIAKGDILIDAPKKLNIADIGLLASSGIYEVEVRRRIKIAFFSTGDELSSIGRPLASGQIYDSNRHMLKGLLADECFSTVDLGVIPDNKQQLYDTVVAASETHDAIITTGGASIGEADFIEATLTASGQVSFWKLAVKPGKPLAYGTIGQAYFFGLPGNPVSVFANFHQVVKPALDQLAGAPPVKSLQIKAICQDDLEKSPGRQEFMRGILTQSTSGEFQVKSAGKQDSHILSTLSRANCYIVLPLLCEGVRRGDTVIVEPFGIDLSLQ